MRAKTLLLGGLMGSLVACADAQAPPGDLLQRVTQKVLDTVDRLPRYMCTQTIDRYQYEAAPNLGVPHCEPAPNRELHLFTSDRLRLDVAVSASREMYSWVGESHFEERSLFDMVGGGALSTGSFSAFLSVIFRTDHTGFTYQGPVSEEGRQLEEFDFRVPQPMSHYVYSGAGNRVITGYYGTILVDPKTADLVRLEVHTEPLPAETGSCQASSVLDYTRLRLNDTDFLLPQRSQLDITDVNGKDSRNTTVFSNCHEFLGESTLHFGSEDEPGAAGAARPAAFSGSLPAGIPFQVELTRKIDPATAAAGDRVEARLTGPMRDENRRILVPKGAAVTLRIREIRRFYHPMPALRVTLKTETVEVGGVPYPLMARPEVQPVLPPGAGRSPTMMRRSEPILHVQLDNRDPQAAVFDFLNTSTNFTVPSYTECRWITGQARR